MNLMRSFLRPRAVFSIGLVAGLANGCATKSPPPAPVPLPFSSEQISDLRSSYKKAFPNAKVGVVAAVMSDQPYVLVNEIDSAGIRVGSIVTFIDATETVITNGRVELINANGLTVRFDEGKRRPAVGDAAIRF
jgi:hypothetical protein